MEQGVAELEKGGGDDLAGTTPGRVEVDDDKGRLWGCPEDSVKLCLERERERERDHECMSGWGS